MHAVRKGQRWDQAEQVKLLDEIRGGSTLAEIAAGHQRSQTAICDRIEKLLAVEHEFSSDEALFEWARAELRTSPEILSLATERAHAKPAARRAADVEDGEGWTPARVQPATATRRGEVAAIWSSILASADHRQPTRTQPCAELDVLAAVDDARLERAGLAVLRSYGELSLASWVLECDWPGIESLGITAEQIRRGDDAVPHVGADLLLAGLGRERKRDREILRMRLGLTGEATTFDAVAERFGLSRERIRQIQSRAINRARVSPSKRLRRCWHHVHDTLLAALRLPGQAELDPDLVLSFVTLAVPTAPRHVAVSLVARLCGLKAEATQGLVDAVDERHDERARQYQQQLQEEKARNQLAIRVQHLVDGAIWPAHQTSPAGGEATPLRSPTEPGPSKSGYWRAARLGRRVGYDSEAELRIIQMLDLSDDLIASYCEQPVTISYILYEHRRTYYPDLLVDLSDGRRLLIEVKGRLDDFALYENVVKFHAAIEFCAALGWGFAAITNRLQTPSELVNRHVDDHIDQVLRDHLDAGPTDWEHLHPLAREHGIKYIDIATLALRHGWYWHKNPYRLSTTPLDGTLRWDPIRRRTSPT